MYMSLHRITSGFDIIVVGGGLSGMCAAVAAARMGAKVAIVQNRPVFGGNASSEIRMHIVGANCHQSKANLRETGILEELLLENKRRNPYASFPQFDVIMWELIRFQPNLTSYLNTNMDDVVVENNRVKAIICHQSTTETELELHGRIFVDATGHGTLGVMAGGAFREGSESKYEFGEPTAPERPNTDTMGNSIMFVAADRGEPVKFEKPVWANTYSEEDLIQRPHANEITAHADGGEIVKPTEGKNQLPGFSNVDSGYWWIELGGDYGDIIQDSEQIRDDLLKCVYGVWDHLKNVSNHGVENYDLEWVGMVPGYRESRRLEGEYILTEKDIRANRQFPDAVAYGAWPMDVHVRGGLRDLKEYPSHVYNFDGCYTIPYRCYCSKNIENLMMAGRDISASKMAFSSVRVMGTCAIGGQAVGTAAAMAVQKGCTPKEIGARYIRELQQLLLKNDCYIPGIRNEDPLDLARKASVTASSETEGSRASNVINGISRSVDRDSNCWESGPLMRRGETIQLSWDETQKISQLRLTFDTNLSGEIMPSLTRTVRERQVKGLPCELVRDYQVALYRAGRELWRKSIENNGQRLSVLDVPGLEADQVRVTVTATHGWKRARIYEVRVY